MAPYQALYYPFIHFKTDAWVKMAALYWDKLGRIVPDEYETHDSDTVKDLGSFVVNLPPFVANPAFDDAFLEFIADYGSKLQAYRLSLKDTWQLLPEEQRPPKPGGPSGNDARLGYIYHQKMSPHVYDALNQSGLASTDARGERW